MAFNGQQVGCWGRIMRVMTHQRATLITRLSYAHNIHWLLQVASVPIGTSTRRLQPQAQHSTKRSGRTNARVKGGNNNRGTRGRRADRRGYSADRRGYSADRLWRPIRVMFTFIQARLNGAYRQLHSQGAPSIDLIEGELH